MSETESRSADARLAARLPILCLITDLDLAGGETQRVADTVNAAVQGGVNMVQARAPNAEDDAYHDLIEKVNEAANGHALVIANVGGRCQSADTVKVDGLHVPDAESAKLRELSAQVGRDHIIGSSAHSSDSAFSAMQSGAHYAILGTLFATASHPGGITQGLSLIHDAAQHIDAPLLGIGGIGPDNAASVISAGASGVAVIRAIAANHNPRAAAAKLYNEIHSAWVASHPA